MTTVPPGAAPALGKGAAVAIEDEDYVRLALDLRCHPADIEAIAQVESAGFGWFDDGRIKILFEKHWFYKLVATSGKRTAAVNARVARKNWVSPKNGGYKDQATADQRYAMLQKAIAIDEDAAYQSISVGKFQIMGFNHKLCGFPSAKAMFEAFMADEDNQLEALSEFLRGRDLVEALKASDFATIERVYNGGGLNGEYAKKMGAASAKLRRGKWANWNPDPAVKPLEPAEPSPIDFPEKGDMDNEVVAQVQRRLKELGYTEIGNVDGDFLDMTEKAILIFRHDAKLPLTPTIDEALLVAMAKAAPRQIPEARSEATPADVRQKVPEVSGSWW
ncbi:MAG: N-acetylmuramidase domain-containing protein, partial [Devosia sp.]